MGRYYGQKVNGVRADAIIAEYFPKDYMGTAIEVGATNGITMSNTYYFEQKGWLCLCIEPNSNYFEQLKQNRKHAQPYACGIENAHNVNFTIFQVKRPKNESAISSLLPSAYLLAIHKELILGSRTELVEVRTLDHCIEEFGLFKNIDFISIDTEGTELDVLKGLDIHKWQPRLFIIENNTYDLDCVAYLKEFGYELGKSHYPNDFFIRSV